jgi:predicted dehydrogenase
VEILRAAVIGAGNMGRHHVRILGAMEGIELVAAVDPDTERAFPYAKAVGAIVIPSLDDLPDIDIAVVATPTHLHLDATRRLLESGVHVLVEKPLASTPAEAEELVSLAEQHGVVLAVGHVENFNPAADLMARLVREPKLMQFERLSPYTPRIRESIVFDLMVHDLDLAMRMAGAYPTRIQASGARVFSDTLDVASAILEFPCGCVATLSASRATQDKVRRIAVSEADRFITADTMRQEVLVKREAQVEYTDGDDAIYRQASVVEVPHIDRRGEPLALELADFVGAVRAGGQPLVTGAAGLAAVRLAYEVERVASSS